MLLCFVALVIAAFLLLLRLTSLGRIINQDIPDRPRRRLFYASVGFFVTFAAVRLLVASITHRVGPFGWVEMPWSSHPSPRMGILILLLCGYGELTEVGDGDTPVSILLSRLLALSYGVGSALTLDEFALWLNLNPLAYWSPQGRESIDAIILFGALLSIGAWGAPLSAISSGAKAEAGNGRFLPDEGTISATSTASIRARRGL